MSDLTLLLFGIMTFNVVWWSLAFFYEGYFFSALGLGLSWLIFALSLIRDLP
jgi:hypothetical protein